ncbi:MAG: hypothetical protein KUG82_09635 [Pseudomonadales bacterium]|nr:hypothetical protein [Pseudomonadales bacterium]
MKRSIRNYYSFSLSAIASLLLLFPVYGHAGMEAKNTIKQNPPPKTAQVKRGRMERIAKKNLGRDISFDFHSYLLGLTGMRLDEFRIAENEQYLADHPYLKPWTVRADSVDIKYNPFALFIGRISVRKIGMINPQVQFSIDRLGRTNFDDMVQKRRKNKFSNWIRTHHIGIENMQMTIISELLSSQPIQYYIEDINVDIRNLIKRKVAPISITARTPGALQPNVEVYGAIGPIVSITRMEESPMDIHLSVSDAPLDFELAKLPDELMKNKISRRSLVLPESGRGDLSFDIIGSTGTGLDVNGSVSARDVVLATINKEVRGVPFDVITDLSYHYSLEKQLAEIKQYSIRLDDAEIAVTGYVDNITENATANLSIQSSNMDMVKLNDIYPFVSQRNQFKPVDGHADMDLTVAGTMKEGFKLKGDISLNSFQVATLDGETEGRALDVSIDLNEGITYNFHENEINYDNIELKVANNTIQLSGHIKNVTQIERVLTTTIRSDAIDVRSIQEFFPFFDRFIPPTASYDGVFTLQANATGKMDGINIVGAFDFSQLDFVLPGFAKKTNNSPFDVEFSAGLNESFDFYVKSSFVMKEGALDNATLYISALEFLLGGNSLTPKAKEYLANIDPHSIRFEKSSGNLTLNDLEKVDLSLEVLDIRSATQKQVTLVLAGTMGLTDFDIDLKGEMVFPQASYHTLVELNPKAARYVTMNSNGQKVLVLPVMLDGIISEPRFSSQARPVVQDLLGSLM